MLLTLPVLVVLLGLTEGRELELVAVLLIGPLMVIGSLSLPDSRVAAAIGALSFPLYAVHVPVQWAVLYAGGHWTLALAISIVAGFGVGLAFDKNCRKAFDLRVTSRGPRLSA